MSAPAPRVSICLPTHDGRAEVLDRALRSIAAEVLALPAGTLEVCVSDNGSQDATQRVLADHAARLGPALRTSRFATNRGFTPNLLNAVELARGEFCWLMGSDDELEPGSARVVLDALAAAPDLSGLTLNRRNLDDEHPGEEHLDDPHVLPPPGRTGYSDAASIFAELAMLQDYISTQVVRRAAWLAAVARLGPEGIAAGRNFPHMPILGEVIVRAPRWGWVAEPLIRHRIGTRSVTSTFDAGLTAYTILVTEDRAAIWRAMFGRRSELYRRAMRNIWRVQAHTAALAHLKRQPDQTTALDLALLRALVRAYWFIPRFWLESVPVLLLPHALVEPVFDGLRAVKRRLG